MREREGLKRERKGRLTDVCCGPGLFPFACTITAAQSLAVTPRERERERERRREKGHAKSVRGRDQT